jgi:hypothetical protein
MSTNVLDLLLQADESKLIRPSKQVEIKRLSAAFGIPVIFTCEALTSNKYDKIQEDSVSIDIKNKDADFDMNTMRKLVVVEGVKEPNLKSKELRDKYKAPTPIEVVKAILLPGEIQELYSVITELSGFGENAVEEVKNLQGQTEEQK